MSARPGKLSTVFSRSAAFILLPLTIGLVCLHSESASAKEDQPRIVLETSMGKITIELYPEKAPKTVENFLWYVNHKFYDGLTFHRVKPGFMIQGGGFTKDMIKKQPNAPIVNEADNGLSNSRGTIAMARINDPHSATSQFFINLVDNKSLDHKDKKNNYGYAVFGTVTDGMDVVDAIAKVSTTRVDVHDDVPAKPVLIVKAYQLKEKTEKKAEKK